MPKKVALSEQEFAEIQARSQLLQETEPRAVLARYDRMTGELTVEMRTGARFAFPVRLVRSLGGVAENELENVTISPTGGGLHWPGADMHLSVPALIMMVLGSEAWLKQLQSHFAREAGSARSAAKARAARENGKKGGRPRKMTQAS